MQIDPSMPMFITPPSAWATTTEWQEFLARLQRGALDNPSIQRNIQWAEEELARRLKKTPEYRRKLYDDL